jgi:hypothetical protein
MTKELSSRRLSGMPTANLVRIFPALCRTAISDSRVALGTVIGAGCIFFGSLLFSAHFYFYKAAFNLKTAVISHLQSPIMNPHGYLIASLGAAIAAVLLFPAAIFIGRHLVLFHPKLARVGFTIFALGILETIVTGALSPFPNVYEHVHLPLAFATFISLTAGIVIFLVVMLQWGWRRRVWRWGLFFSLIFLIAVLVFTLFLYFTPGFFDEKSWLRNRAVYEWALSACLALYTFMLVVLTSAPAFERR